jgi:hypothetical protein
MSDFTQKFWNKFALLNSYTAHQAEFDTPRNASRDKTVKVGIYNIYKNQINKVSNASTKQIDLALSSINLDIYNKDIYEDKSQDNIKIEFRPTDLVRFTWRFTDTPGVENDWLVLGVGNIKEFNRIKKDAFDALQKKGFAYKGKQYGEVNIFYGHEALLMRNSGFRSRSRQEMRKLNESDRTAFIQLDAEKDSVYLGKGILNRSFSVRQSASIKRWIGDGLHILDTTEINEYNGKKESQNAKAYLLSRTGAFLGDYEEEIDDSSSKAFGIVESSIVSYKNSKVPKTISDLFKTETQEFKKAAGAPIFVGFRKTQLGFDWLTRMPSQASKGDKISKKIVSLIGSDAPLLQNDQVYLALEDCDIVTGKGRDLVILADDIRNKDVNSVPRIHDFDPKQDKVLIPVEVFGGFSANASGTIGKTAFHQGKKATNKNQRLIYDRSLGYLYHDRDGSGKATQQLIAAFTSKPSIAFDNFLLG